MFRLYTHIQINMKSYQERRRVDQHKETFFHTRLMVEGTRDINWLHHLFTFLNSEQPCTYNRMTSKLHLKSAPVTQLPLPEINQFNLYACTSHFYYVCHSMASIYCSCHCTAMKWMTPHSNRVSDLCTAETENNVRARDNLNTDASKIWKYKVVAKSNK